MKWHCCNQLIMPEFLRCALGAGDPFGAVMNLEGKVVRAVDGRRTFRFTLGGRSYFAKTHNGMNWMRILRKLLQFRIPVLGAEQEWQAIHRLQTLNICTTPPVAFGCRGGLNPVRRRSFLVTEDLGETVTLNQECRKWPYFPPNPRFKRALITEVARIARTMHEHGMNHRDFYLCHFRLNLNGKYASVRQGHQTPQLYLMDLHRMQYHNRLPYRARCKDIGGLYFSAMDIGLTSKDIFRFLQTYTGLPLRRILQEDMKFLQQVHRRARLQYKRKHGCLPTEVITARNMMPGQRI
jgi:heptose I phosphotransferase